MHIAEIIITSLFGLAFILLGLFNPDHMDINLFGLKSLSLPSSLLTFSFFLMGAAYVAFWTLYDRFKKQLTVNRLKGRVKELEEKLINKEQSPEGIDATEDEMEGAASSTPQTANGTASQPQEAEYIKEAK